MGDDILRKLDMSLDDIAASSDKECRRLFVGNLPYSCSWQDLKDHMRSAGEVLHCDIIPEPGTACGSKGCGIVEFATSEQAQKAIATLTDSDLKGRPIFLKMDREWRENGKGKGKSFKGNGSSKSSGKGKKGGNNRVFVGNLAFSADWKDLKDHMRQAGDVLHCDIIAEPGTANGSKGCGLVEFATAADARRAIRELSDTMLRGRQIFVREDREADSAGGARERSRSRQRSSWNSNGRSGGGRRVFVGNLAFSVSWQDLKDHMREAGDVTFCEVLKESGTKFGSKGCAIVEYSTAREAKRAIRRMTDTELKGRVIFVREDREE
eukprot:TRINITY_DN63048_c0_g1_i1.p2 TRINITY_DN63048_c0_g1~~TRINITY_DN63048_c0_g1_i1.p2  ORF type:complete len:323 (+),score=64.82 TRINITY_DN63048_c0_g1_i1:44-1012(+)